MNATHCIDVKFSDEHIKCVSCLKILGTIDIELIWHAMNKLMLSAAGGGGGGYLRCKAYGDVPL